MCLEKIFEKRFATFRVRFNPLWRSMMEKKLFSDHTHHTCHIFWCCYRSFHVSCSYIGNIQYVILSSLDLYNYKVHLQLLIESFMNVRQWDLLQMTRYSTGCTYVACLKKSFQTPLKSLQKPWTPSVSFKYETYRKTFCGQLCFVFYKVFPKHLYCINTNVRFTEITNFPST